MDDFLLEHLIRGAHLHNALLRCAQGSQERSESSVDAVSAGSALALSQLVEIVDQSFYWPDLLDATFRLVQLQPCLEAQAIEFTVHALLELLGGSQGRNLSPALANRHDQVMQAPPKRALSALSIVQ